MKPAQLPAFMASVAIPLRRSHTATCVRHPSALPASQLPTPSSIRCAADPNKVLSTKQLDEWRKVSEFLQELSTTFSPNDTDKLIARAFGWGTQRFWRGDVREEVPCLTQVRDSVTCLKDVVGLDDEEVALVAKKFPEVLRLRMERMRENIGHIHKNYPHIKAALLVNAVKETPAVLGFDFDCEGDCQSECERCWVQF